MRRIAAATLSVVIMVGAAALGTGSPAAIAGGGASVRTFYLTAETEDCSRPRLTLESKSVAPRCGSLDNALQEPSHAAGNPYDGVTWSAKAGLPFSIDASKPVTGEISVGSFQGGAGAGQATVELALKGKADGKSVAIGRTSETYSVTPNTTHTFAFEVGVPENLHGAKFTSFVLKTVSRGPVVGHGWYELSAPASFVVVPILKNEKLTLTSPAFKDGGMIPARYSCFGENLSPPLEWSGGPIAQSYLWVLVDLDWRPFGFPPIHWLVYDIPGSTHAMPEGRVPAGAHTRGDYIGPCHKSGDKNTYVFTLYALDRPASRKVATARSQKEVERAIKCCVLAKAKLSGEFRAP